MQVEPNRTAGARQLDKDCKREVNVNGLRAPGIIGVHWKNSHGLYRTYSATCLKPTDVNISKTFFTFFWIRLLSVISHADNFLDFLWHLSCFASKLRPSKFNPMCTPWCFKTVKELNLLICLCKTQKIKMVS